MKRTVIAAITLLLTALLTPGALAEETQRYLVATRTTLRVSSQSEAAIVLRDIEPRRVGVFKTFRGFAADLTTSEVAALQRSGDVRWVEPVQQRSAAAINTDALRQTIPYGIEQIGAPFAWKARQSDRVNVVIADTGIDGNHPDLRHAFAGGWNAFTNKEEQTDDNGHGTHVAGTIAAADNQVGVVGVAPDVRLWAVKVLNQDGEGSSENVIAAIDWTVAQKEKAGGNWVVNLSLSGMGESPGEKEALDRAFDAGVLVVAAAGNMSTTGRPVPVAYPAAHSAAIAVGAVDKKREVANFSNQGPELDLTAPGVGVLSTLPSGSKYLTWLDDTTKTREVVAMGGSGLGTVTAPFVYCGVGEEHEMPASLSGQIALFQRGVYKFAEKARRAMARGAIAVVIFNNVHDEMTQWTLFSEPEDRDIAWPIAVQLSRSQGEAILASGATTFTIVNSPYDYAEKKGTSMSTPHVVGAIALLWSVAPDATAQQILEALYSTATDLGQPGHDPVFGWGEVNVYAAAKQLAPSAFVVGRRRAAGTPEPIPASGLLTTGKPVSLSEIFSGNESDEEPSGSFEVVVARLGADGKPELACVGSEQAARDFLEGRRERPSKEPVER